MSTEPKRLRLGSDALAASVASLQRALPSEERMAALAARLAQAGAPVDARPRPALRLIRAAKVVAPGTLVIVAALVFGGGLIATAILIREGDPPLLPSEVAAPVLAAQSAVGAPTSGSPPLAAAPAHSASVRSLAANPGEPESPVPSPAENASAALAGDAAAPPLDPHLQPNREPSPVSQPSALDNARTAPSSARTKALAGEPAPAGAPLAASTVTESEISLLKEARSALSADPLQAFALSERCRAQYPSGAFAQEREYIAISALVRLGRGDDARSRASLFRMHYPNSAYLPRLARMLGE